MNEQPSPDDPIAQKARDAVEKGSKAAKDASNPAEPRPKRSQSVWPRRRRSRATRLDEGDASTGTPQMPQAGDELLGLYREGLRLLFECSPFLPMRLTDQINSLTMARATDGLVPLHSRALDLLSQCSRYVPEGCREEIYRLADETGRRTLMPVRVERVQGAIVIDPYGIAG
jgi:hypothetical protein